MKIVKARLWVHSLLAAGAILAGLVPLKAQQYIRDSGPELFSYDELVQLSLDKPLTPKLAEKVRAITTTPFINNEAYYNGARPRPLKITGLGPSLRIAFWNIERGLELDEIQLFLTHPDRFMAKVKEEREIAKQKGTKVKAVDLEKVPQQIKILKAADVWILNEVDWGMKRTQYRKVVRDLAKTLRMNWAYGVEFLEIDPKQIGTETFENVKDEKVRQELLKEFRVDKSRLRALHGTAVLSRYPIRAARVLPFKVGYDWFEENKIHPIEKAKRKAAVVIGEDLAREMRRGGRMAMIVDLDVPEVAGKRLTIAATHLENRATPKIRRQQMEELLQEVRNIANPVVIAGDMNTTGSDSTPTNVQQMLIKRYGDADFWASKGIQWATGLGLIYTGGRMLKKITGIQTNVDPTSANVPGLSANREQGLFNVLEKFRFEDGKAFDFRGVRERTVNGTSGTLGDSNQRARRGFVPTFVTELTWGKVGVARFKLDWIFVKSNLEDPRDENASYVFAPHFPRTLSTLDNCLPERISDHSAITVDLPFHEPTKIAAKGS